MLENKNQYIVSGLSWIAVLQLFVLTAVYSFNPDRHQQTVAHGRYTNVLSFPLAYLISSLNLYYVTGH